MFVSPRWLRVSSKADYALFEVKDLDEAFSEILRTLNGGLTDDNVAQLPVEAVAWHGKVAETLGETPSWKGHVHDGVSARRLAAGFVGKRDVPFDGSLGVLFSPEDDYTMAASRYWRTELSYAPGGLSRCYGPNAVYLVCGKFGFAPGGGGVAPFDATYRTDDVAYVRRPVCVVPFDPSEIFGRLYNPVVVASLRAEMSADTLPERAIPFRDSGNVEDRFWGLDVTDIQLFPISGSLTGSGDNVEGYVLAFSVVLPGPDHPISRGVGRWWVDWMMLAHMVSSLSTPLEGGGGEG